MLLPHLSLFMCIVAAGEWRGVTRWSPLTHHRYAIARLTLSSMGEGGGAITLTEAM